MNNLSSGIAQLLNPVLNGHIPSIARAISLIENEVSGYADFLESLPRGNTPVLGITGPPGAGKSTLVNALVKEFLDKEKRVAVLCVDPSSPFNMGALLGDRIRMNQWYNDPRVFIRSMASRGSLGGLNPKMIEITDLMKVSGFDIIIVETVGVGQSEIEIAGLADITVVVLVPEAGDEVQTMKAGLMEIADVFVVNKSDRPDADVFVKNLNSMLSPGHQEGKRLPVIKTVASDHTGIDLLFSEIKDPGIRNNGAKKNWLLTEKAFQLIQRGRMADIDKTVLKAALELELDNDSFNLYRFVKRYL